MCFTGNEREGKTEREEWVTGHNVCQQGPKWTDNGKKDMNIWVIDVIQSDESITERASLCYQPEMNARTVFCKGQGYYHELKLLKTFLLIDKKKPEIKYKY